VNPAGAERVRTGWLVAAGIGAAVVGLAFAVAPRACAGGLEIYAAAGMVALAALGAVPFLAGIGRTVARRIGASVAFVALGAVAWLAGLVLANVRFICGLGYL
jgi:hypothetical protein